MNIMQEDFVVENEADPSSKAFWFTEDSGQMVINKWREDHWHFMRQTSIQEAVQFYGQKITPEKAREYHDKHAKWEAAQKE